MNNHTITSDEASAIDHLFRALPVTIVMDKLTEFYGASVAGEKIRVLSTMNHRLNSASTLKPKRH